MAGVPAPLTKLNQAGQDALKQNLQGVSFSNSVPAPQDPAAQYKAAANAYTASHWTNGTANGLTGAQNLANVINQPGNTAAQNPTPYIQGVLGQAAKDTAAQQVPKPNSGVAATNGAVPNMSGPSVPAFDAAGIAASRVAAQRAALANSVNAYDASRKSAFDYMTKNTQDQRVLDGAMFHETDNPFSGKYQYDKTNILRNNGIQDTQNQMQYNNDIAASDAKLAAFDAGAPGMQQDIEQQLNQQQFQNNIAQAPLTGQFNGQQTQQAQAQGFNQNLQTNQFNQQAQNQQFNQTMATNEFAYKQARDAIGDEQYKAKFDNDVKQQGFENAVKIAVTNHQMSQDAAQLAISQQNANISQQNANTSSSNASWAQNPNNPDNQYKLAELDKLKNGSSADMSKELDGLYSGLTSGQITASAAISEIDGKVKAGLTTPTEAAQMKQLISTVSSSQPNVRPNLTQAQIDANGGNNPQDLNSAQLENLWKTDPSGKAAGRPSIDWADWYTDPRGHVGGISYDAWKQAYGPQLKAR